MRVSNARTRAQRGTGAGRMRLEWHLQEGFRIYCPVSLEMCYLGGHVSLRRYWLSQLLSSPCTRYRMLPSGMHFTGPALSRQIAHVRRDVQSAVISSLKFIWQAGALFCELIGRRKKLSMNSFRIGVFRAVATNLNLSRAGQDLGLSRQSVAQHIKALEQELGTSLFVREGRGIMLTAGGQTLLSYSQEIESLCNAAQNAVIMVPGTDERGCALGASRLIGQ